MKITRNNINHNFSEEVQAPVEPVENVVSVEEAIQSLSEKYNALPTLEAKNSMKEDMIANGIPEDMIFQITGEAPANFSEDVLEGVPVFPEGIIDNVGPTDLAVNCDVKTAEPYTGTLPEGPVVEPGVSLQERIQPSEEMTIALDGVVTDPMNDVIGDSFDNIL